MEISPSIDYKSLYEQSELRNSELENQLQLFIEQLKSYDSLQIEYIQLKHQIDQLKKAIYASRRERFVPADANPSQLSLAIQAEEIATCNIADAKKITYIRTNTTVEQKPLVHPGRMKLPETLRREEIIIEPTEDTTDCKRMGEEITEVLEYEPGELFVKKYVRVKYAKPQNSGVLIGQLPARPLDKAMAGPGLLAQIVIDKYADHLPLVSPNAAL